MISISVVHKLKMPMHSWLKISKLFKKIHEERENWNRVAEDYMQVGNYGKLYFDLIAVDMGAKEDIYDVEKYM